MAGDLGCAMAAVTGCLHERGCVSMDIQTMQSLARQSKRMVSESHVSQAAVETWVKIAGGSVREARLVCEKSHGSNSREDVATG